MVELFDRQGNSHPCRVLLDNCSQSNYITERMASRLNLRRQSVDITVTGLNLASSNITESVGAIFRSRFNRFAKRIDFLDVPYITGTLPSIPLKRDLIKIPSNIRLADPEFYKPANVDALFGIQLFYKLLCSRDQLEIQGQKAVLQKTQIGWIIAGEVSLNRSKSSMTMCHLIMKPMQNDATDSELTRFWALEQVPSNQFLSPEEQACESHFSENVKRNDELTFFQCNSKVIPCFGIQVFEKPIY
ncbi:uncharacterized protein LOC117176584 [Belonocnema kinseyi]|uniref:uncharacterized protein LOC117176584 n=1 Tax=Belonocnema kinseyi TaxID=2817044 RepID=UPI00143D4BAA|nr:uncharacterized protein LOC117176584 [Belonocnema kinseyi]